MWQFLNGDAGFFASLERRAAGRCLVFPNQAMPAPSMPSVARVGVEIDSANGSATLFVDHGVEYSGPVDDARRWLADGQKVFLSIENMRTWIQNSLRPAYASVPDSRVEAPCESPNRRPCELTDLTAVASRAARNVMASSINDEELFGQLTRRIRGQDDAIRSLTSHVCRHLNRRSPRRPCTLLALGPTGVGKTASAEYLPIAIRQLLPEESAYGYLRLDMCEYQEQHRVSQLLGSPQGYIGHSDGSQLVNALRDNPRLIVLFDEIDKAHPHILRALMNAMDAGRLASSVAAAQHYQVDCKQTVFIFTSNLDAAGILDDLTARKGFGNRPITDTVCRRRLKAAGVAPELIGRVGCFLVFRPLETVSRAEIVTLAICRIAGEYGLRVTGIDPSVVADVLNAGRDNNFGARPDEYIADALLGSCFAEAAHAGLDVPAFIETGPPYRCVPHVGVLIETAG